MNIKMTKDEFHEIMMLYFIELSKEIKEVDEDTTAFSENFDQFLRHIASKPLGDLKTVYYREDARDRMNYNRMKTALSARDEVRIMI